jgi:2-polyprenyl-6-methoxyphenol hydroxylase-like FAD-dependent oxidoreductase
MRFRSAQDGQADYLMTTLVAVPHRLGAADEAEFMNLAPRDAWQAVLAATAGWHPALRDLYAHADVDSFVPVRIRAAERVAPWTPGPVTLLGDAIHAMPPTAGLGANTALRDAATLATELLGDTAALSIVDAVAAYERVMIPRGFETVANCVKLADYMLGTGG